MIAMHIAIRAKGLKTGSVHVLDPFVGVGGNLIQFAKICGFCQGVDIEQQKVDYTTHNAKVYGLTTEFKVVLNDFLLLPESRKFDAVFLSPPWGGTGYQQLSEYSLDNIYPDFDQLLSKALAFSSNLILFLPKNTSIHDLITRLSKEHKRLKAKDREDNTEEMIIEIEKVMLGPSCKAIVVYTGDLAKISTNDLTTAFTT